MLMNFGTLKKVVMKVKSRNLNYCYYVEYYEHQQLRFTEPQSDDTAAVLKKNNKCLTDYEASKNELMTSLADILVLNKFELLERIYLRLMHSLQSMFKWQFSHLHSVQYC